MKDLLTVIVIVIALFAVEISTSSQLEDDEQFMLLNAQVNGMQANMDQLINQAAEEKILRKHFQEKNSELETIISQLVAENAELKSQFHLLQTEFRAEVYQLKAQCAKKEEELYLFKKINERYSSFESHAKKNVDITSDENYAKSDSSPRLIPPSSCRQLSTIGHYLDGIYLVANSDTNKIETVYCDFGSSTLTETLFGSVDIKTKSVHFYVQRRSDFNLTNAVIPFEVERLNVGGAMNLAAGVFTVPVDGIYHFQFSGLRDINDATAIGIALQVNGVGVGSCYGGTLPINDFVALSGISASLRLKTGDRVTLNKSSGTLNDDSGWSHFTGWLVEEELVLG